MLALSNRTHIGVVAQGEEAVVLVAELCRRFDVDALIRLGLADYELFAAMQGRYVHFNLEFTLNEVGKRYAVLPILRQGRRDADGTETLPLVDQHRHRIGLCDEVIQRLPIGEVGPAHFAHSLPNIRTPEALEAALLRRYAPMF